jgi:hypothetical protein
MIQGEALPFKVSDLFAKILIELLLWVSVAAAAVLIPTLA